MNKSEYIESAIEKAGRMTKREVEFALERLRQLADDAVVPFSYFYPADTWFTMCSERRRAKGADFALRQKLGEFPGLLVGTGSNANVYVKRKSQQARAQSRTQ